jgi:hypothetical protein
LKPEQLALLRKFYDTQVGRDRLDALRKAASDLREAIITNFQPTSYCYGWAIRAWCLGCRSLSSVAIHIGGVSKQALGGSLQVIVNGMVRLFV